MLKKTLLSVLLTISTLATAQINLDLTMKIQHQGAEHNVTGIVTVEENIITPIVFDGVEALIIGMSAQAEDELVTIQTQFFQKTETDELEAATELFTVQVPLNEAATITVNDTNNDGAVILVITPSLVE